MPAGTVAGEDQSLVFSLQSVIRRAASEAPAGQPARCWRYNCVRYPAADMLPTSPHFVVESLPNASLLRLESPDATNRLTRVCVESLTEAVELLARASRPLIITGNSKFFSAGADLSEIVALAGPAAYEFSKMGQRLMNRIERFPARVFAAVEGYCMGGGLDLVLACHHRIASPHVVFGHRGAALGLITGWGGTQRLPKLVGKARALTMLVAAEKVHANEALQIGLVDVIANDPVAEAVHWIDRGVVQQEKSKQSLYTKLSLRTK
jgi:enoyl-CoA hydratase